MAHNKVPVIPTEPLGGPHKVCQGFELPNNN
jgi:hypothetical protein